MRIKTHTFPGRPSPVRSFSARFGSRASAASLHLLVLIAPAFLFACIRLQETPVSRLSYIDITRAGEFASEEADLFFFEASPPYRLDSYMHLDASAGRHYCASAGNGAATVVLLSNVSKDPYSWADIDTYASLSHKSFLLDEELSSAPQLSGEAFLEAGWSRACVLSPSSPLVRIRLLDLNCDFSGRPYSDASLENVKAFLTRACVECQPLRGDRGLSWANPGMLDSVALSRMKHPEYLYRSVGGPVGKEVMQCGIDFYTYPNPESGVNGTRLVLECDVGETHCYYPLCLPPLVRNTSYDISVQIGRMGTPDPDTPAESAAARITLQVKPWHTRQTETVTF